tara:strand:+ start:409 stop:579 length:171 start_codon:yes stop_codon:yes gene_type:complete
MANPNPLEETTDRARDMLKMRMDFVRESLAPKQRHPLLDMLPRNMTPKMLREALNG